MADIYKRFAPEDVIAGDTQAVSSTVWSNNVNPLTTFSTGSNTSSFEYYVPVYDGNPATTSSAAIQFSVAYGNINGSGSLGDTTVVDGTYDTPSKVVYSQFRNLLLPPTDNAFSINSQTANDIYVLTVNRARYKQKIDPGNWQLNIGSGANKRHFIDGSGAGEDPSVNAAGRIFNIYSGSGGVKATSTAYGLFYPDLGIMVFSSSAAKLANITPVVTPSTAAKNAAAFFQGIKDAGYFAARTEERITSNHYFVRVTNQQFNYSNNPTFVSGSNGMFKWSAMLRNPQVYITTVGLYDDNNRLLAVAKLSRPLLKTFNREALVKVKIDY
tara:strand:- start:3072 stop:4052 length:981 start_codon:yes stop_codon:yes gene_type:complete